MPVVVHRTVLRVAFRRDELRGSAPQIVVDRRGYLLGTAALANAIATLVAEATRRGDLAEVARLDPFDGFAQSFAGANLRAGLDDAVVLRRRGDELAPLPHRVRYRLLEVDVLAGLHRPDAGERVPVIRRCHRHGVDVGGREHLAHVHIRLDVTAVDGGLHLVEHRGVRIADGDDAHAGNFCEAAEMISTAAVETDHTDAKVRVGAHHLSP